MSAKTRLDVLLVERGLMESRQKAQSTIMSGLVFVNQQRVDKPGTAVANDAENAENWTDIIEAFKALYKSGERI